jgi:hypothetical protein
LESLRLLSREERTVRLFGCVSPEALQSYPHVDGALSPHFLFLVGIAIAWKNRLEVFTVPNDEGQDVDDPFHPRRRKRTVWRLRPRIKF